MTQKLLTGGRTTEGSYMGLNLLVIGKYSQNYPCTSIPPVMRMSGPKKGTNLHFPVVAKRIRSRPSDVKFAGLDPLTVDQPPILAALRWPLTPS